MANNMVTIGAWNFYPDGPLGQTHGFNTPHPVPQQTFTDMLAMGMTRIRVNVVMDGLINTQADGKGSIIPPSASPSTWNWGFVDTVIEQANKLGIRVTLIARGLAPASTSDSLAWQVGSACTPGKFYTTAANYAKIAVALARRYSGDGNPDNKMDSTGKKALQADCIEIGNEEFNTYQDTTTQSLSPLVYKTGCDSPMRYVSYVRTVLPLLRASTASGGGGWVPRGNFLARVGQWGIVHSNQLETKVDFTVMTAPPTDSTWNASGNHNSIFGFDSTLNCQMLDYANFHNYTNVWSTPGVTDYDQGKQCADIRNILNAAGNTSIPIWCTETGADGPCSGSTIIINNVTYQTEPYQASFFTAKSDGTGAGVLPTLRDAGCQHVDVFTVNDTFPNTTSATYLGQDKSVTASLKSNNNSFVRFAAFTNISSFNALDNGAWATKAWPAGFGNQPTGGGGGGGTPGGGSLTGAFAPLAATNVNLTTEGQADYGHWGVTGTTFDHKATGGSQISDATVLGNASKIQNPGALNTFTYTDGTPNTTETATATGIKTKPPTTGGAGATAAPHVMVVALENTGYSGVVGNSNYANINSYLSTYSTCTKAYGFSHPSLPNYLTFASGWDQGVTNDTYNPASAPLAGNTLVDQLIAAGVNWKHYQEHMGQSGSTSGYLGGDVGTYPNLYVQHHNPWTYFKTIRSNSSQYNRMVDYADASVGLSHDLTAGTAPPFIFVTPGNEHNAHTGSDSAADAFVGSLVSMVQASTWYTANSGIIVLWWDESGPGDTDNSGIGDTSSSSTHPHGGHICCVVISANNSGATLASNINHAGVLRGIQKLYGLNPFLGKATNTINGDLTPLLGTTAGGGGGGGGGSATNNTGNGFKISAPADTNSRTLKIYTDVNQGIATLVARLSDGSAPDWLDSTLQDNTGGNASAGVYTLTYQAASTGQTLTVFYTLSDNKVPGVLDSSDTFTRANQSGLGTTTPGGQSYTVVQEVGSPAWAISSNQAKMTGSVGDTGVAVLGTHTLLDCESVGIVNLSNTADSGGLILRSNSAGTTYYRASLQGSAILLAYVTGGVTTVLNSQPASPKTNTNYWIRFRIVKSSLYAKFWPNDGTAEPANWNVFASDTTLATAGNFGFRAMIGAASDQVLFDTYSIVDLSAVGDPSYVSLYAADLPTGITTASGSISVATSTPSGTIDLTATGEGDGDWIKPGYSSASSLDRKANVTQQISAVSPVGSGTYAQNIAALLAWSWEDGTPDTTVVASTTESTVQGVSNGFSLTVPADTTPRTLNVYVAAKQAQGTLTATLSDGSFATYSDTSLNDTGTGTAKKYQITYNAASPSQTLTITWVMLTDNGGGGSTTTFSTDTYVRSNQSGWGLQSDAVNTWSVATGAATPSIVSNKGQITSATAGAVAVMFSGTGVQPNGEIEGRYAATATGDSFAVILRATSSTTYYKAQISSFGYTITKVVSGTSTDLATASPIPTLVANTKYWLKLRLNGSNLYSRYWADGSSEPTTWNLTATDSSISGSGQYGVRGRINTGGDVITVDSFLVTSIPSGGTPGNIALDAASMPLVVVAGGGGGGGGGNPPPAVNTTITVQATDKVLPNTWTGLGVQQDPYTQGTWIVNGSFEDYGGSPWYAPWSFIVTSPAVATISKDTSVFEDGLSSAKVNITTSAPGSNFDVQLRQIPVSLLTGSTYTITYWAKADSARNIDIVLQQSVTPFTVYSTTTQAITTSWVQYTITYVSTVTDATPQLAFNLAASTGNVWIDVVTVNALSLGSVQRALINTRLGEINPSVIRTCADAVSWWCPSVAGTYTFDNPLMLEWYNVFEYAQQNNINVIVGVNSPAPFSTLSTSWCTAFADLINYLINTLGYTCIQYVSGLSEPELH